ncbi:DNA polymerase beta superfamily protein [Roseibium sp.]|uniref:nucleotidyltransferase domain-containing protein n=1 Tax=Roseibium sp. TaxID=1936156 RepID=UPI00391A9DF8
MEETIVAEIKSRLQALEKRERIGIPLAIESGSRAWGFPSPNSDYDCRFIFVRETARTYTLFPERDVLEEPVTEVFDINGWELSKALKLLHAGNAVAVEWLMSPFAYQVNPEFRTAALDLAAAVCSRDLIGKHYFHLMRAQIERLNRFEGEVSLKKTLYVLRPLAALKWLENHSDIAVPPMNFQELRRGISIPENVSDRIDSLLELKSQSAELGSAHIDPAISDFVLQSFDELQKFAKAAPPDKRHHDQIDKFWRDWSARLAPEKR